jgi:hypothetical protein
MKFCHRSQIGVLALATFAFAFAAADVALTQEEPFPEPKPGHLYVVAQTAVYDITGGGDMSGATPYFDGAADQILEGICIRKEKDGRYHMYLSQTEKVEAGVKGSILRDGKKWAWGFSRPTGLACSANHGPFVGDLDSGKVWNVATSGDYSSSPLSDTPLAQGLDLPFSVIIAPGRQSGAVSLIVGGRDKLYSFRPRGAVTEFEGMGMTFVGLSLWQTTDLGGGPAPRWLAVADLSEENRGVFYMPFTNASALCNGSWNLLADFDGFPDSLVAVGAILYMAKRQILEGEPTDVYRLVASKNSQMLKAERFAWNLPPVDLGGLAYAHTCGDGIVEPEADECF